MDIARQRLLNQRLVGTPFRNALEVVTKMGAVQAQDYAGAKWGIAQRTRNATDADIERLITDGTIIRTHVLRPTWHLVAAKDLRWMLALTAPRIVAVMKSYNHKHGLTPAIIRRSHDAVAKALGEGKHLTRAELLVALRRARIGECTNERLWHLLMHAELDLVICSGARRGKEITYALFDDRCPPEKPRDRDESLADLATRYFATRAPATAQDFAWWSGLTVADAKRGMALCTSARQRKDNEDSSAHLLPNYDEFFIGYRDRSAILTRVKNVKLMERFTPLYAHVIEVDGQIVGGWRRVSGRVETTYLARVTPAQRAAVQAQAERYWAFAE